MLVITRDSAARGEAKSPRDALPRPGGSSRDSLRRVDDAGQVLRRFGDAENSRRPWEHHWEDCYAYTLPRRSRAGGINDYADIYDATAADGIDSLASGLLAYVTPPWSRWLGFAARGEGAGSDEALNELGKWEQVLHEHFVQSNFIMEIHQCYLDLVIAGTACLLFEEAPPGEASAFRFSAVPIWDVYLEESADGKLGATYRRLKLGAEEFKRRFAKSGNLTFDEQGETEVIEAVYNDGFSPRYLAVLADGGEVLRRGSFTHSPFINFRWMKALGESYGRSPVMKALPDIKTANKVVEFILKRASLTASGMWQAEGAASELAEVEITPGVIIPRSEGRVITPIEMPSDFDVSQIVLSELRGRIKAALLADRLSLPAGKMTATEVVERSVETARLMGATFGRLQYELLKPLAERAVDILIRRGELPKLCRDRRRLSVEFRSPLAQAERRSEARNLMTWLEATSALGGEDIVNRQAVAEHLARLLSVPTDIYQDSRLESARASR